MSKEQVPKMRNLFLYCLFAIISICGIVIVWGGHRQLAQFNEITRSIIIVVLLLINFIYIHHRIYITYGQKTSESFFILPVQVLAALVTVIFIFQIFFSLQYESVTLTENYRYALSLYSDEVVVNNWENIPMEHPDLNALYQKIFSSITGNEEGFETKEQWEKRGLKVKYVPFEGNELEWHYAAKFCQFMTNTYRMFNLNEIFEIHEEKESIAHKENKLYHWLNFFKVFLKNPTVRNVWEQYKYRHANPGMSAWVKYYITDPIDDEAEESNQSNESNVFVNSYLQGENIELEKHLSENIAKNSPQGSNWTLDGHEEV